MTDFLDKKHQEITDRLKELKPQVEEYSRLEAAASALAKTGGSAPATATASNNIAPRRRGPGRPRGSVNSGSKAAEAAPATASATAPVANPVKAARKKAGRPPGRKKVGRPPGSATKAAASSTKRRAGRRKGSGTRSKQALRLVREQPGITIPELASKMKIQANYLYRVLPGLEQDGKLEKKGRGYHPKQA